MPANREKTAGINIPVRVSTDKSSVAKVLKDLQSLSKTSQQNVIQIRDISKAAEQFTKKLGTAAKSSFKQLKQLGDQLNKAHEQAEELESQYAVARGDASKAKIAGDLGKLKQSIAGLNKAVEE